jgi:formate hydrogenlyase transcriptional activator
MILNRHGEKEQPFFDLLKEISYDLILNNYPEEVDSEIDDALRRIARFFHVERCSLGELDETGTSLHLMHTFLDKGGGTLQESYTRDQFPWLDKNLRKGKMVIIPHPSELPKEALKEKAYWDKHGLKSVLIIPLMPRGKWIGTFALASVAEEKLWSKQIIHHLSLTAQIFATIMVYKRTYLALQNAEMRYRLIADTSIAWVYLERPDGSIAYVSPSVVRITGYQSSEIIKNPRLLVSIIVAEDQEIWEKHATESHEAITLPFIEYRIYHKDGTTRWIAHTCQKLMDDQGNHLGVRVSNWDITERKQAEEALRISQGSLAEAQRIAHLGNWDWNIVTNQLDWSDEIYRIFGLKPQEFGATYEAFLASVHPEDRKHVQCAVDRALKDPAYHYSIEHRVVRRDGSQRVVHERGEVTFNQHHKPIRMIGTVQDITERKQMEEKLERQLAEISALEKRLESENIYLRREVRLHAKQDEILGRSPAIRKVLTRIAQVAPTDSAILIQGETGTGKELIAQAIHNMSKRKKRLMVKVNCASLPAALIESELFGREKGAYTGALSQQIGRFELAHNGTIFLDEVGELTPELQVKLLRVLQEGEFERLGSPKTIKVNVRVIAASNKNLTEAVAQGTFREDLYYRLNVFPIHVPPLRERREDINLLVWNFVNEFAEKMNKETPAISQKTMEMLEYYDWPGNVRELRNVIEYAMIILKNKILHVHLPEKPTVEHKNVTLEENERRYITSILRKTNWRIKGKNGAASLLGLKPSTLYTKMNKLGIPTAKKGRNNV